MEAFSCIKHEKNFDSVVHVSEEISKSKIDALHDSVSASGESLTPLFKVLAEQLIGPLGLL